MTDIEPYTRDGQKRCNSFWEGLTGDGLEHCFRLEPHRSTERPLLADYTRLFGEDFSQYQEGHSAIPAPVHEEPVPAQRARCPAGDQRWRICCLWDGHGHQWRRGLCTSPKRHC